MVQEVRISPECPGVPAAADAPDTAPELRKQISVFVRLSDFKLIRDACIRAHRPMTELVREWIAPHLKELRREARTA